MGQHYSSVLQWVVCVSVSVSVNSMNKFLIASCLAVATLATPESDPSLINGNALVGSGGISPAWPTTLGYGVQSTCYGCRGHYIGKRSAEADPYYGFGYAAPFYGYGHGSAHHGGHATSFVARSPQGLHGVYGHYIGKRSAEADPSRIRTPSGIRTSSGIPWSGIHPWWILWPWIRSWIWIRLLRISLGLVQFIVFSFK